MFVFHLLQKTIYRIVPGMKKNRE